MRRWKKMVKIESIEIQGFRGFRDRCKIEPLKKSVIIYGENGSGKSSLTDAVECFFSGNITPLKNEEAGRSSWRNVFIEDDKDSSIDVKLTDSNLNSTKSIDNKLSVKDSNNSASFKEYIQENKKENLVLRNRELLEFITASKSEKLNKLQEIIGFSDVASLRSVFQRNVNRIDKRMKTENYDREMSTKQSVIMENLDQNAYTDDQFYEGVNKLVKPIISDVSISSHEDIKTVLTDIKPKEDNELMKKISFLSEIKEKLNDFWGIVNNVHSEYSSYLHKYRDLAKDSENIKK